MSIKNFSVLLLKESKIKERKNKDRAKIFELSLTKIFELSLILIKVQEDFFDNKKSELLAYFNEKLKESPWENSYGELVNNKIVNIIDYYEILDDIDFKNFTEVYSRYIIGDLKDTPQAIIEKYHLD